MSLKNRFKKNSLAINIWFFLIIFSFLILGFLWLFQIIFLDSYYKYYKTKELNIAANELKNNHNINLEHFAMEKGICIEIYNKDTNSYSSTYHNQGCMEFTNDEVKNDFINSNKTQKSYNLINNKFKNQTLLKAIKLDDNNYAFINASLVPMDKTIKILQSQMIYVTIVVLILSFIIGYFISRKISKPITKISTDVKKMAEGNYNIVFSSNEDIYEINELVDNLNYTKKELSKTDELKRDLIANISHDLKTPLTMIKAYAEMVRDLTYKNKEKREDNLNTIIDEADRLNLLVNDILDLSAIQSNQEIKKEEVDLIKLSNQIIKKFGVLTEKEGYIFIFNHPDKAIVIGDKKRLYQVIYNLINNAINYTGEDKKVILNIIDREKTYLVEIIDTGKGIKEEELKYIWDKYYHNKKKHKRNQYGTGLGLSIVKNILQNHNCEYGVKSSKKGSIFYFEIKKTLD